MCESTNEQSQMSPVILMGESLLTFSLLMSLKVTPACFNHALDVYGPVSFHWVFSKEVTLLSQAEATLMK